MTSLAPLELDLADDEDDEDDDDDEDDEDEVEDDDDLDDRSRTRTRTSTNDREGGRTSRAGSRRWARSSSPIAAAWTVRTSPASPHDTLGERRARRHRQTARAIPGTIARWRCEIAARFGLHHEIIQTNELEQPEYRANPTNRCYFCKHELYSHLTRIAAERQAHRGGRQQRRRSGRLPARPSGGAGVRRPESAGRSGSEEGRDPGAIASGRSVDVGRAGIGMPVVADSVSSRSDRREAAG